MDKKTTLEMIAAISNANGTSGFEDEVVAAIRPYAEGLGEITEDRMRNLYIRRKENNGKRPVVQLDAHSDEVGFMVQAICPNGTLRIIQIGGWVNHNIPAHKVLVRNRFGEYIPGLTAGQPSKTIAISGLITCAVTVAPRTPTSSCAAQAPTISTFSS